MNRSLWVITYDISSPKRWRKVFKILKSYGRPVQYSVFECRLSKAQVKVLHAALQAVLDEQGDRVHCYPLCGQCDERTLVLGCGGRVESLPAAWIVSDTTD
jgi:CRISPR-associated protein Cas2